ncbi:MAG TPA: type II secretion system protein E [Nitrospiraceae bacterium]|nr:type II secretion system protein E [Nitrospiraceae bacterium]HCZ12097.1 type II secretion system protein E [Nitrospiraceae bacterium]
MRIGDLLKARGLLTDEQLHVALIQQKITGTLLGDALVNLGFISSKELGRILAEQSGIEFIDLGEYAISENALRAVQKDIAEKAGFIPLDMEDGRMTIGITNPSNIVAVDTATRAVKSPPKVCMVDADSFRDAMDRAYFFLENPIHKRMEDIISEIKATETATGAAVTNLANLIIMDGIRKNATDIHVNPTADMINIFYRVDGVMQHGHGIPKAAHNGIVSRIKILAQLDIAEQRLPQDGSFRFDFLSKGYDLRISTIPTIYGENIVMRILAGTGSLLRIEMLGFDEVNTKKIKALFHKPYGIILITGPTGSGKTTTLYAALREINLIERNVLTVEDPVEYKLSLIKQTQVNEKAGYDFALAGRNFMRQDPDVMLLGEIRDEETAKIAIRSSITGHLVLSTLHTNDAVTAIPRLLDLQVDRFLMSSSLLAIMAQRLARKICRYCKIEYSLNEHEISVFKEYGITLSSAFKGKGCSKCSGTGYTGRTVIGEILIIDDEIREMIYSGASIIAIKEAAVKKGMRPLKEDAIIKAAEGITTLDEVLRVAG